MQAESDVVVRTGRRLSKEHAIAYKLDGRWKSWQCTSFEIGAWLMLLMLHIHVYWLEW